MADRVYPSSKPTLNPPPQTLNGGSTAATNPSFPATKSQLYGASRPQYRPQPKPRRRRRSCWCCCCLWTILFLIALILLAAIAGAVFWVLYHPQRPSFSITSLKISQFNVTTIKNSDPILNSKIDLVISARNPNKKIGFIYNPIFVYVMSGSGVDIGNGTIPGFVHGKKNTTSLKSLITSGGRSLDKDSVTSLNSDLKKKYGLPLEIELETKVKVKIGSIETEKLRIRVNCKGVQVTVPKGKSSKSVMKGDPKCKVNLRFKIWKWTF